MSSGKEREATSQYAATGIRLLLMVAITAVAVYMLRNHGVREALFVILAIGGFATMFDVFVLRDSFMAQQLEGVVTGGDADE